MSRALNRNICQSSRTARHPCLRPADVPRAQRRLRELSVPRPLKRACPRLVPNVVARPVVLAHVDQRAHAALEERRDVVVRRPEPIDGRLEGSENFVVARGEVGGDGRVDTELRAHSGAV